MATTFDFASSDGTVTWYYRGTFGSQRPADPARIRIEDHVDDLVALMDARAIDRARLAGPALTWLAPRIPVDHRTAWLVSHSGFMLPGADPQLLVAMLREFVQQDWTWYADLAVAASQHKPMDLAFVRCPVTLVAGRHDVLTSMHDVIDAAARIPHAQITVLPGSHFLPLEHSDLGQVALEGLARRSDLDQRP